jgi:cell division protein FtsL
MADNLIVITLIKKGFGKAPGFILKVFEDEKVFYEGFENVKVLGSYETTTIKDGFVELLELVKETGFFTLKDDYCIISDEKTPRTEISVSIPITTGEVRTKTVKFLQKDPTIPEGLKKLENKIVKVSGFDSWDKRTVTLEKKYETEMDKYPEKKTVEKKSLKFFNIKNKKVIAIFFTLVFIISFIVIAYQYDLFNLKNINSLDDTKIIDDNGNNSNLNNKSLTINTLDTTSEVSGLGSYTKKDFFKVNESVFVYLEYSNFSVGSNGNCDLSLSVLARKINGDKNYTNFVYETNSNKNEHHWEIKLDGSWSIGTYYIIVTLTDNISNNSVFENDIFSING